MCATPTDACSPGALTTTEFLCSGEIDEFSVDVSAGNTLHLRYRGGTTCEDPGDPDR